MAYDDLEELQDAYTEQVVILFKRDYPQLSDKQIWEVMQVRAEIIATDPFADLEEIDAGVQVYIDMNF